MTDASLTVLSSLSEQDILQSPELVRMHCNSESKDF